MKPILFALTFSAIAAAMAASMPARAQPSTAEAQVDALEQLFKKQAGVRRSQAKGLCATGTFTGNVVGSALSRASAFSGKSHPVVFRFSVGGGNPKANDKGKTVRGLAFAMSLPKGEQWLSANISAPMYFVSKPEQFVPFLQVRVPDPATGKPDPAKLKAFNEANPETTLQGAWLAKQPVPASYAGLSYFSTNAFEFINAKGQSQFVRWQIVPPAGLEGLTDEQVKAKPDSFLADELRQRVASGKVSFDLKVQLAEAGDTLTDPTQVWPDARKVLPVGTFTIDKVEADGSGACDDMTFNPLVLPKGIQASTDPVLNARPAPYAVSLGRRLSEKAQAK